MSTDTRKIRLEVDTGSIHGQLRAVEEDFRRISTSVMSEASRVAGSGGDATKFVNERVHEMAGSRGTTWQAGRRREIDEKYMSDLSSSTTASDRQSAYSDRMRSFRDMQKQIENSRLQVDLMRELIDTIKIDARREIASDKSGVIKRIKEIDKDSRGVSDEERLKIEYQRKLLDKDKDLKEDKRGGWTDVFKGVLAAEAVKGIVSRIGRGTSELAGMTYEETTVAKLWSAVPVIGAGLAAANTRTIELQGQVAKSSSALAGSTGLNISGITSLGESRSRESAKLEFRKKYGYDLDPTLYESSVDNYGAFGQLTAMFGARKVGAIGKKTAQIRAIKRVIYEKGLVTSEAEEERRAEGVRKNWSYSDIGISHDEFIPIANQLAMARGTTGGDLASSTKNILSIEKSRGIDRNSLMGLASAERYMKGGMSDDKLITTFGRMEDIFKRSGIIGDTDRSRMGASVASVLSLTQSDISRGVGADPLKAAAFKGSLESLGGRFANDPSMLQTINAGLTNPQNEWSESSNYQIYAQQMRAEGKQATYVGFKKWQEQGYRAPGLLQGRQKMIKSMFGDSEMATIAEKSMNEGLSWEESSKLAGKETFDLSTGNKSTKEDIADYKKKYSEGAAGVTTQKEKSQAEITDAFIESETKGLEVALAKTGDALARKLMSAGAVGKELGSLIKSLTDGMK